MSRCLICDLIVAGKGIKLMITPVPERHLLVQCVLIATHNIQMYNTFVYEIQSLKPISVQCRRKYFVAKIKHANIFVIRHFLKLFLLIIFMRLLMFL